MAVSCADPDDWWNPFDSLEAWGYVKTVIGPVNLDQFDELAAFNLKLSVKCNLYKNGYFATSAPTTQNYNFVVDVPTPHVTNCISGDEFENFGYHSVWYNNLVLVNDSTDATLLLP